MSITFNSFPDSESMNASLANLIAERLTDAIGKRGQASLVVSGGNTPRKLFARLSTVQLDWQKVTITLADERWTDVTSEQSNEYMVRNALLINFASDANFIGLKSDHHHALDAVQTCSDALANIRQPFDIVLLGMGDDGHTASLFPGVNELSTALDMQSQQDIVAIKPDPLPEHAPFERLSMTLPKILDSRWVVLLISGKHKLKVYNDALAGDDPLVLPIRSVLRQSKTAVSCYWAP